MKTTLFLFILFLCSHLTFAQKNKSTTVPLIADKWSFQPGQVEFIKDNGVPVMKIMPGAGKVLAKDIDFTNGTIEFDVKLKVLSFFFPDERCQRN